MISQKSDISLQFWDFGTGASVTGAGRRSGLIDLELLTSWVKQKYWDPYTEVVDEANSLAHNVQLEPHVNIIDTCLRDIVCGSDMEVVMEIARCCLHEEPRQKELKFGRGREKLERERSVERD